MQEGKHQFAHENFRLYSFGNWKVPSALLDAKKTSEAWWNALGTVVMMVQEPACHDHVWRPDLTNKKKIEEKIKLAQEESCKKDIEISRMKAQQQATIEAYKFFVSGPESPQSLLSSKATRNLKAQPKEKPGLEP